MVKETQVWRSSDVCNINSRNFLGLDMHSGTPLIGMSLRSRVGLGDETSKMSL